MGAVQGIIGTDIETGALSSIYCATNNISVAFRGATFKVGPKVAPFKWETKAYNAVNSARVFDAINTVTGIAEKGFRAFD